MNKKKAAASSETISPQPKEIQPAFEVSPKKSKSTLILLGIFVALLIGASGFFIGESLRKPAIIPQPQITPLPTQITDGGATWKTYTNSDYNFEFKYPNNFQTTQGLGQSFLSDQNPVIELISESFGSLQKQHQIDAYFTVSIKPNAKSDCEYIPRGLQDTVVNKEINGNKFTVYSYTDSTSGNQYLNNIYHFLKGINCYEMVTTIHEMTGVGNATNGFGEQRIKLENQLGQILSTFKFLDQTDETKSNLASAKEALNTYFSLLNEKKYSQAVNYHGSGYDYLNTDLSNNPVEWLKVGCEHSGLQCLKIKTILQEKVISQTEFFFLVQFINNDGTLFKRGPCCGATEETMPTKTDFEFTVKKQGENYLIVTQPVYVP